MVQHRLTDIANRVASTAASAASLPYRPLHGLLYIFVMIGWVSGPIRFCLCPTNSLPHQTIHYHHYTIIVIIISIIIIIIIIIIVTQLSANNGNIM